MTPINFGGLPIDPVAYGSQGNAILGIRGSGKTYTATFFAERLFEAGIPFIAFDPIGVWRFLRVPGDGQGYQVVVAGGVDGDLPLSVESAPEIVRAAMRSGVSVVIDLFDINLSKADWKRIVGASLRVLLHENAEHGLRHVFLEEAAEFAPQRVGPDQGVVYAEVEKLARMGGNARLGYTLINQRSEEVAKAVLELCDNLFLHRQKGRNSLIALEKWLDIGNAGRAKEIVASMSTLPSGECWAWMNQSSAPDRIKVPTKNSFHPDRTVLRAEDTTMSRVGVDVGDFVSAMKAALDATSEGKKPAKNITGKITEPSRKALLAQPSFDETKITEAYDSGFKAGDAAGYDRGFTSGAHIAASKLGELALNFSGDFAIAAAPFLDAPPKKDPLHGKPVKVDHPTVSKEEHAKRTPPASAPGLTGPQAKTLQSLAWWASLGVDQPLMAQVAIIAGWSPNSSNIRDRLTELSRLGHIERPIPGAVMLSPSGAALAPAPAKRSFGDAITDFLTNPQRAVYQQLLEQSEPVTVPDLARLVGWSPDSSNIRDRLTELSALTIVSRPRKGFVELAAWVRDGLKRRTRKS